MKHNSECCIFEPASRFCCCIEWELSTAEIEELIEQWHENDHGVPLHSWLGMSWGTYQRWVGAERYTRDIPPFNRPFPVQSVA